MPAVFRLAVLASACLSAFAAAPTLLSFVPPDARIVSGIDATKSLGTPFGRYVLERMEPDDDQLRKLFETAGFDPRHDVAEILAITAGTSAKPSALVVARGVFAPARFSDAARLAGASVETHGGCEILTYKGEVEGALTFLDSRTALAGDPDAVKAAIDRRGSESPVPDPLASLIRDAAAANDAWFASAGPIAEFLSGKLADENVSKAMNGGLLASVEQASGGAQFGASSVQMSGKLLCRSDKDARSLGDVLRFLASLIQVDPGKGGKSPVADAMRIDAAGPVLRFGLQLPESVVEQLFMSPAKPAGAR